MKFPTMKYPTSSADGAEERRKAAEFIRIRGAAVACKPPRLVLCQSGSRKIVATWEAPSDTKGITGWNVYSPDESTLYAHIEGLNNRRCDISASPNPAAAPLAVAVFVSSCGPAGVNESLKTQGTGTPTAEASAPSDPTPAAGSTSGGTDRSPCTEIGTELEFPPGSEVTQWLKPCAEWYGLKLPERPKVNLAKGTLVKVWIPVEEILSDHRIAVDGNGSWATGAEISHEIRESQKQCVTVKPGGEYRAKESGVELHNLKNLYGSDR